MTCRYVGLGHTLFETPMVIDHDDERSTAVYLAPGAPEQSIRMVDGSSLPRVISPGLFRTKALRNVRVPA